MNRYFRRLCRIDVSPDIRVDDLDIGFDIRKSTDSENNSSIIKIYNLNQETRNRIPNSIDALIRIEAGYAENAGYVEIGQGNISNILHENVDNNVITTVYAKDGFKATKGKRISLSFDENTTLERIISKIAEELALPSRFLDYNKKVKLLGGYSYVGSIPRALDELAYEFDFSWSIQNGHLMIINKYKGTKRVGILLSAESGLLKDPESIILDKKLKQLQRNEYRISCLLQPQAEVGDLFKIESNTLSGVFMIQSLRHYGEVNGEDFTTEIIAVKNE